jgi:hypothetical protein
MANYTGTKHEGRVSGTPNKLTLELRTALKDILFSELENLPEQLAKLDAKTRLEIVIKLLPYVAPKLETISYSVGEPFSADFNF